MCLQTDVTPITPRCDWWGIRMYDIPSRSWQHEAGTETFYGPFDAHASQARAAHLEEIAAWLNVEGSVTPICPIDVGNLDAASPESGGAHDQPTQTELDDAGRVLPTQIDFKAVRVRPKSRGKSLTASILARASQPWYTSGFWSAEKTCGSHFNPKD